MHIIWLAGGSCDGCTMAVLGAADPTLEDLLTGLVPGAPPVTLVHPALALDSGDDYRRPLELAARGELGRFVLVVEGSVLDEELAGDGYFSKLGEDAAGRPRTMSDWLGGLATHAEVVLAIGSCATWGGIPAAAGNATGASGIGARLGDDFRSRAGLPVVNVPGCAPSGDAFLEALLAVFDHLGGRIPLELDEHRRPRWLYPPDAVPGPPHADWSPPAAAAHARSEAPPRSAPALGCPVPSRGWMRGTGGCRTVGGACIGCTAPDFVDLYLAAARPHGGS